MAPAAETVPESEEPTDMELSEEVPEEELNEAIRDDISNTHYMFKLISTTVSVKKILMS